MTLEEIRKQYDTEVDRLQEEARCLKFRPMKNLVGEERSVTIEYNKTVALRRKHLNEQLETLESNLRDNVTSYIVEKYKLSAAKTSKIEVFAIEGSERNLDKYFGSIHRLSEFVLDMLSDHDVCVII